MAGSDKDAARSSTGRSKIEPPQPLGEAESSSLAGQLLNSLKAAAPGASAVSHEAKLGMMVITILFFAFCFLVYHKMDLHQRQLTQASIQPTADTSKSEQPLDTAAQLAMQSESSAATDPLMSFNPAESETPTEALNIASAQTPDFGVLNSATSSSIEGPSFEEPSLAATAENTEPITSENAFSRSDANEPMPRSAVRFEFDLDEPAPAESATDETSMAELQESEDPQRSMTLTEPQMEASDSNFDAAAPDAIALETPQTETLATEEQRSETLLAEAPATSSLSDMGLQIAAPDDSFSSFPDPVAETQESLSEERDSSKREPTLLAMLDPQEGRFSGGFQIDDADSSQVTSGRAPAEEPADAFLGGQQNAVASNPRQSGVSGSRGFDAVANPSGGKNRNSIRTAAGSGSDGKFSLSAFNYQNTGAEPAPDDGSTFDTIVVQHADNYSKISKRVYGSVRYFAALAVFNQHRISEPKYMRPGMIVLTPPKAVLEERYPQLFADSMPKVVEPAAFLVLDDGSPAYRVGERETLSEISMRFLGRSSRWVEIYRLNQSVVKDPNKLKAGLILALPADAAEVSVTP